MTKVEFFEGSTKLGEDTTMPYSLVWQGVPAGSYTLTAVATDNDGATTTSRAGNITVEPPPSSQQSVDLAQGWNLVSTHIAPPDPSLEVVLADILPDLVMVRDADGGFYDPSTATNTIGDWEPLEAYMVNVQAPVVLTFEGDQILPDTTSIPLNAGWNLVPYLRDESLPVDVALASIAPHLVLVKDENGQIYYPGYGINTIGDLQPGQGYKIYVDQATTLTFPANNVNQTRTRRSPASGVNQARTLGSPANK